jgi:hypothetical protein
MATEPEIWTTRGFLDHFISIDKRMQDRSFAFVLGSGASRPSGIPTGLFCRGSRLVGGVQLRSGSETTLVARRCGQDARAPRRGHVRSRTVASLSHTTRFSCSAGNGRSG